MLCFLIFFFDVIYLMDSSGCFKLIFFYIGTLSTDS